MTMTDEELIALRDAATPGPWRTDPAYPRRVIASGDDWSDFWCVSTAIDDCGPGHNRTDANARLIAATPDLIDEVLRLRAKESAQRAEAMRRSYYINATEDPHVAALCERYGYGAVMDAASRLWAREDSLGAFYIGGCIGMKSDEDVRAALTAWEATTKGERK